MQSERVCSTVVVEEGRLLVSDTDGAAVELTPNQKRRFYTLDRTDVLLRAELVLIPGGGSIEQAVELFEAYLDSTPGSDLEEEALLYLCPAHARLGNAEKARRLAARFRVRLTERTR